MKKSFFIIICLLAGCATQKIQWHIELEAMDHGKWVVAHQDTRVFVYAGSYSGSSACRHHVLLQQNVLSELGVEEFRFSIGPVVNGEYRPVKRFGTYEEAIQFLNNLSPREVLIYEGRIKR